MMVKPIFNKIGSFIENRHIFMLLNCNCAKLADFGHFKTCSGGSFFVDTVYKGYFTFAQVCAMITRASVKCVHYKFIGDDGSDADDDSHSSFI